MNKTPEWMLDLLEPAYPDVWVVFGLMFGLLAANVYQTGDLECWKWANITIESIEP